MTELREDPGGGGAVESALLAVVRIRSGVNRSGEIIYALKILRLDRVHTAVLVRWSPAMEGQLMKVKDVTCWGAIERRTLVHLLTKRGRLVGDRRVSDKALKEPTGYDSIDALADALLSGKAEITSVKGLKPFFRLISPDLGASRKKQGTDRGLLGDLGDGINKILMKML
jgi:large subunit ribosomal protein L30